MVDELVFLVLWLAKWSNIVIVDELGVDELVVDELESWWNLLAPFLALSIAKLVSVWGSWAHLFDHPGILTSLTFLSFDVRNSRLYFILRLIQRLDKFDEESSQDN